MAFDETTLNAQLTAIQSAITTALANPRPDWQVGQVRTDQMGYLKYLSEMQAKVIELMTSIPSETIVTHQQMIDEFGQDFTQYVNEPQG